MHKAIQELKTRTKELLLVGFLLLAAAIGLIGLYQNDRTTSWGSEESVVQKPQVIQIQKQPYASTLPLGEAIVTESRKQYVVNAGESYWIIANKIKPYNVEIDPYVAVLKAINGNVVLHLNTKLNVPNHNDLKPVLLPEVTLLFRLLDAEVIQHIKNSEGSKEAQSNNKRRLLGGRVGPSYNNSRFYPYKDVKGNYTIGYGHYLGKKDSDAIKYRNGISSKDAHNLLVQDMKRTRDDFILLLQRRNAVNLSPEQQRILYEMAFTLGVDKLNTFDKMWKSVKHNNPTKFKNEIQNSLWYKQVGNRADILLSSL